MADFFAAFKARLAGVQRELAAMQGAHRDADDAAGRLVDAANAELARYVEGIKIKQELIQDSQGKIAALERQVRVGRSIESCVHVVAY